MDKQTRRENMGINLRRQLKGLIKSENNLANAVAFLAVGLILLAGGIFTKSVFFDIIGGCCILLGLLRIIRRGTENSAETDADMHTPEKKRRNKNM